MSATSKAIEEESTDDSVRIVYRGEQQNNDDATVKHISDTTGLSRIVTRILVQRGIVTKEEALEFIAPTLKNHLPNPNLIKGMDDAASMIAGAVAAGSKITIYSDFDVDGISSASQLLSFLESMKARVNFYIPDRFTEGYGLALSALEKIQSSGTELLVTLDCGIMSVREIEYAKRKGMKVIVLDHHQPPETLPPADFIVDPAQDDCPFNEYELCAAGLTWMLIILLRKKLSAYAKENEIEILDPKLFLDLASLGTICDMVPLKKVNRLIAQKGVEALQKTSRPGIVALRDVCGVAPEKVSSGTVGFAIGPRINAAGRLSSAAEVVELLTTKSISEARKIAKKIDHLNKKRRDIEESMRDECLEQIMSDPALQQAPAFAIYSEDFHLGVIGIVAQRLVEMFHKPAAVMAPGEITVAGQVQKVIKGSVRSIKGFHVADALHGMSDILINGGGHGAAGGFSVSMDNLEKFQSEFINAADQSLTREDLQRYIYVDLDVQLADIDYKLATEIQQLSPFGIGNPSPVFLSKSVTIDSIIGIGTNHLKLRLGQGRASVNAVAWNSQGHPLLRKGRSIDVAYTPEINSYKGISSVQLNVKEVWNASITGE